MRDQSTGFSKIESAQISRIGPYPAMIPNRDGKPGTAVPCLAGEADDMADQLMLLPSADPSRCRLVRMPQDLAPAEAYRLVTGLIAGLESGGSSGPVPVDDVMDALDERGFEPMDLILGPSLD